MTLINFLLFLFLIFCTTSATASPCGMYVEKETGAVLEFQNNGTAREYKKDGLLQSFNLYYRNNSEISIRNAENGLAENYRLSADGKKLALVDDKWGAGNFDALQPLSCVPLQKLRYLARPACDYGKYNKCCVDGDVGACVRQAGDKDDISALQKYCAERPDACLVLLEKYQKSANPWNGQFSMYAEKKPIPEKQLQEMTLSCEKHMTPELCRKTLEQLWLAHRFADSRELLGGMCSAKIEENACARFNVLSGLKLENMSERAASIPCGYYKGTASSLAGELDFADRGTVTLGLDSKIRARLEDGLVKVRHDKGGDFVFARLGEDLLLGLDSFNQFEVYRRETAPEKPCLPAIVYAEKPLSSGCGLDKNPQQCCDAGDTQGCNRLGSMAALENDWIKAARYYAEVCGKGVRVGCENWIYTVSKTGDDQGVEKGLMLLCDKDKTHVACDLLELNSVSKMALLFALEQAMKDLKVPGKQ